MTDPRLEDHVVGLELQLVELVERRERASVQGLADEAEAISREIEGLQTELIVAAEALAADNPAPHADVLAESAEDATFTMTDAGMHVGPESDREPAGDPDPSPASHLGV
jgi:hypothetical protein